MTNQFPPFSIQHSAVAGVNVVADDELPARRVLRRHIVRDELSAAAVAVAGEEVVGGRAGVAPIVADIDTLTPSLVALVENGVTSSIGHGSSAAVMLYL